MVLASANHIRCQSCSFVVHDQYFQDKNRFQPGVCPHDGGVLFVVEPFTNDRVSKHIDIDPQSQTYRRVIDN